MRSFVLNDFIEYDPQLRVRKPILKVPTVVSEIVCYEPGQSTATHHHPVQDEIWVVLEGHGEIWVGEERLAVEPSSMIFIPAGLRHGLVARQDSRLVLLFIKSPGIPEAVSSAAPSGPGSTASAVLPTPASKLRLEVTDIQTEARDVLQVELRASDGGELPAFEPGAHIAIDLPDGKIRHYSLCNDWRERDRYVLGVARSPQSRGGSLFVHQGLRKGMTVAAAAPRNGFPLDASAERYLFLAGGIGITPILAMIRWCEANGRPWRLAYAVRSAQRGAFLETLSTIGGGSVHLHSDDRESCVFDPIPWLAGAPQGEHVYCCGPAPMMAAIKKAAAHRDPGTVHFEYFNAPTDDAHDGVANRKPFTIELKRSGRSLAVPADKTVLEILEQNGLRVVSSCREGTCRTCETGVCEGTVEHRDYCLTPEEQRESKTMMVCVSRAKSERLVLDI
ncbi:MAG: cupin domain-containing protein [Burkholderiaceae bacterium]|nr:cupin domain-containing protein [Burkholderiaceae bacterium]